MLELQKFIYEDKPSRIDLLNYSAKNENRKFKVFVYRNHSFEMIEHTISAYLDFANISIDFQYSDYDDSLSFVDLNINADLVIVWLDLLRYSDNNIAGFIDERLNYLSKIFKKNILFIPFGKKIKSENKNIATYDLSQIENQLKDEYTQERLEKFSGTKLSSKASLMIAKDLGLRYLPACLMPSIKAIVLDLDNTLYKGVLGEDGRDGVELTKGHKEFQKRISELSQKGFFVCIASKNEEKDVIEMFEKRTDFPLKLEHVTKLCASWNSKTESIKDIQKFLNIGIKDMLFVDDNPGEIAQVKSALPEINVILAKDEALKTLEILNNYPRMMKLNLNYEDSIRQKDTQANEERMRLKNELTNEEFLKSLNMEITYCLNKQEQIERISELANKTNQFICSYKRYSIEDVKALMNNKESLVISVSLKDKLSNSGIIGVLVFEDKSDYVEISECFISCRALGRGIDGNIILNPIKIALEHFNKSKIKLNFTAGDRNAPAQKYIDENLIQYKNKVAEFNNSINNNFVKIEILKG